MDELEKLREKVLKDPNSKLFVSLAEQYRKAGKLDEAMEILKGGVERQPGYMSARVALGKIYLEKGMHKEAMEEFEKVVEAIPDNLFAQKKLSEMYTEAGDVEKARKALKAVVRLNPMDEDAVARLARLESLETPAAPSTESLLETTSLRAEISREPAPHEEPLAGIEEAASEEIPPVEEEAAVLEAGFTFEMPEMPGEVAGEERAVTETIPAEAMEAAGAGGPEAFFPSEEPAAHEEALAAEIEEEEWEAGEAVSPEPVQSGAFQEAVETAPAEEPAQAEAGPQWLKEAHLPEEFEMPRPGAQMRGRKAAQTVSMEEADSLVAAGDYAGALGAYWRIFGQDPGNMRVHQRIEELRMLIKLLGKEKDVKAARLGMFLSAVMRKRDEFFGNS